MEDLKQFLKNLLVIAFLLILTFTLIIGSCVTFIIFLTSPIIGILVEIVLIGTISTLGVKTIDQLA